MNASAGLIGAHVGWRDHLDEPELRGKVLEVDTEYNYLSVAYRNSAGREMICMAPAKIFRLIMKGV